MANVQVSSIKMTDHNGQSKTIPFYFGAAATVSAITTALQGIAAVLDDTCDALITEIVLYAQIPLPGNLKSSAGENTVHEGAAVSMVQDNSAFKYSSFWPSLKDTYFTDGVLLKDHLDITSLFNAIGASVSDAGNNLVSLHGGKYRTRK